MKRTAIVVFAWVSLSVPAWAQQPVNKPVANPATGKVEEKSVKAADVPLPPSPGETQTTPEARQYEQYLLRQQAAEDSVIRAAKARAEQRTRRLESRHWFGLSNQRPMVSTDPFYGDYAPHWVGNDALSQYRWIGAGQPWVIVTGD